jgi:hypothetical protein
MLQHMTRYLAAEKQESLLFVLVGLLAIGIAAWLWTSGHRLRSMAFPLVAVALIQLVVGANVYLRTDTQIRQLSAQLAAAPVQFKTDETQRMETVMKNFTLYRYIEFTLLALGAALIAFALRNDVAAGIGAGLVIQSAFMLCLDVFAEARGHAYLAALRALPVA